jgi:putative transposase
LYAAINVDSKVVLHVQISEHRGTDPAAEFLRELKEKHRVSDAEFLVDGMGYLTALARTGLAGDLNYSDRNIVEKLFRSPCESGGFTRSGTAVRPVPSAG